MPASKGYQGDFLKLNNTSHLGASKGLEGISQSCVPSVGFKEGNLSILNYT
jgi:hypothetical protein